MAGAGAEARRTRLGKIHGRLKAHGMTVLEQSAD